MTKLLARCHPNFRHRCKFAGRKRCTCHMRDVSRSGHTLRKRAQRLKEKRELRSEQVRG